jgi:hypothetical protein
LIAYATKRFEPLILAAPFTTATVRKLALHRLKASLRLARVRMKQSGAGDL